MRAANIVKSKNNHSMYVKIEDINVILDAVEDDMTGKELSLYLKGKLNPIEQFEDEPVEETKTTTDATAGDEVNGKQGTHSRKLGFDRLEEVITAMIERDGMPPSIGRSFFDLMKRRAGHSEKNTIKLEYEKEEAARYVQVKSYAVEQISADFVQKFKEKFNGFPSAKLLDSVKDDIAGSIRRYTENHNANNPKGLLLEFVLSPNIGTCDCDGCKVTPLN